MTALTFPDFPDPMEMPARLLVAVFFAVFVAVVAAAAQTFEPVDGAADVAAAAVTAAEPLRCRRHPIGLATFATRATTPFADLVAVPGALETLRHRLVVDALVAHADLSFKYADVDGLRVFYGGALLFEALPTAELVERRNQAFPRFSFHRRAFRRAKTKTAETAETTETATKTAVDATTAVDAGNIGDAGNAAECVFKAAEAVERCFGEDVAGADFDAAVRLPRAIHDRVRRFSDSPSDFVAFQLQEAVAFNVSRALRLQRLYEGGCARDASKLALVDVFGVCLPGTGAECAILGVHPWEDECGRNVVLGCDGLCDVAELHEDARRALATDLLVCGDE